MVIELADDFLCPIFRKCQNTFMTKHFHDALKSTFNESVFGACAFSQEDETPGTDAMRVTYRTVG
eukprot:m.556887 g.556887  ORF g.556887 m.556887 type:complete len:65 (-) comp22186_c0_seq20:228-422(-)